MSEHKLDKAAAVALLNEILETGSPASLADLSQPTSRNAEFSRFTLREGA